MADQHVLIPFRDEFIALSPEQFHEALELGRALMPAQAHATPAGDDNRIVDAAGAAKITDVPETWFLEQARRGEIPHLKFGKYVRFNIRDVLEAVSVRQQSHGNRSTNITEIKSRRGK